MNAIIKINMDNAAFEDNPPGLELARILRRIADYVTTGAIDDLKLRDINGNTVGSFKIIED